MYPCHNPGLCSTQIFDSDSGCNPVAYDIKYDCKCGAIVCCHGPAICQLHHCWALKESHDEVMLTLREKDDGPTACTEHSAQSMFQAVKLSNTWSVMYSDGTHCYSNDNRRTVARDNLPQSTAKRTQFIAVVLTAKPFLVFSRTPFILARS